MLKEKTVKAIAWQTGAKFSVQFFSFAVTIILARKLAPADYGLVGMAAVFTGLLELLNGFGINSAIIQGKDLNDDELSSAFWFVLLLGCGLCCAGFLAAPAVASFYGNGQISLVIRVLSLNFVFSALKTVPQSILTKQLMFDKSSKAEIVSSVLNGTLAIVLAFNGFGVWSLVCGSLTQSAVSAFLLCLFASWRPSFVIARRPLKGLVGFGTKVVTSRIQWYLYSNCDYFIIGRVLGDRILGFYTMAFRLATLPTEKITAVINEVMFPVFSSLNNDREKQKLYFLKITKVISMLTVPIMALLIILAEDVVTVMLTEKWLPIVTPFRILCFMGIIRSVDIIIPQVLIAQGKAGEVLRYSTLLFFILPPAIVAGCYWGGMNGVAYAWLFTYPVLVTALFRRGFKALHLSLAEYLINFVPQVTGTAVVCVLVAAVKFSGILPMGITKLVLLSSLGAGGYLLFLFRFHRTEVREVIDGLKSAVGSRKKTQEACA